MSEAVFLSLITADRVIVEAENNKKTIIGTFSFFNSPKFPVVFQPWTIYAAVTNLVGQHSFSFNIVQSESGMTVFSIAGELKAPDRNIISELIIPVVGVGFPRAGNYSLTFNVDASEIGTRLIRVQQIQEVGPNASKPD